MNRSNKGTRSGGIGRFSTMVVVGNYKVGQSSAVRALHQHYELIEPLQWAIGELLCLCIHQAYPLLRSVHAKRT